MFNLWKPLIPHGQTGTWAPVIVKSAGHIVKQAWYFNGNFPWLGMLFCAPIIGLWYWCTDQYIVQRALGAPDETTARRGSIFASFLKLFPGLPVHHSGHGVLRSGQERQNSGTGADDRPRWQRDSVGRARLIPHAGRVPAAARPARHRGGRPALGPDGIARRRLQRLFHAVHRGSVPEVEAGRLAASDCAHRPHRHRCHGADRAGLDPGHQGRAGTLHLFAVGARLPGAAHLCGLLLRRVLQAPQRAGRILGLGRPASCWASSACVWIRR